MRIRDLVLFTLDPGWENSNPRSGINFPDPQHCPEQKRFVDIRIQNVLTESNRDQCASSSGFETDFKFFIHLNRWFKTRSLILIKNFRVRVKIMYLNLQIIFRFNCGRTRI